MLKISEAVIVEGRYDKIKLSNLIDALIIETNGFEIFKNKEKIRFIRRLAEERGIILITDSDSSGFMIRNFVSSGIPAERIKHIYIPDIYGKEKRKTAPSSEGKLGVEGISDRVLLELFEKAGVTGVKADNADSITTADLYELGLSGKPDANKKKKKLLSALDLPELLSTSSLISYLNSSMTRQEFIDYCNSVL